MKTRKLTAWIVLVAMIITMLPSTLVFAAEAGSEATCPEVTATMYVQDGSKTAGDDLLLSGDNKYEADPEEGDEYDTNARVFDDEEKAWQQGDVKASTTPTSRRQALSINAKSNSGGNFGINHQINPGAITYTFLDLAKAPLSQDDDGIFEEATDYEWQDYIDLPFSDESIDEFNASEEYLQTTRAINQQLAANNRATVVIWNIVKSDFEGYLRVRMEDSNGYITYQDILIIADGKYPVVEVETETEKTKRGSVETEITGTTIIPGRAYREYLDEKDDVVTEEIESDWFGIEDDEMLETIGGYLLEEKYWANNDVNVTITANDEYISSELDYLTWEVYNNTRDLSVDAKGSVTSDTVYAGAYVDGVRDENNSTITTDIVISEEGQNTLVVTAVDKAGLSVAYYYYIFIDKTAPEAEYKLVQLDEQVMELFSVADTVTKWQQGIDMSASKDVTGVAKIISEINESVEAVYQYRLLAKDPSALEDVANGVPAGYTLTAPADTNLEYGKWLNWSLDAEVAVIDEEFDGLIQVRVQDRAGNWSVITADEEETIIADNTDAVLEFDAFAIDENGDIQILDGSILEDGEGIENRETEWINESAALWVAIKDEDLANQIRSSGLFEGTIKIEAAFNEYNENDAKSVTLYGIDASGSRDESKDVKITDEFVLDSSNIEDYCFVGAGGDIDKQLGFMIQYDGTGTADLTFTITDKAENVLDYSADFEYNVRLKVDKINPYIIYKGFDITDTEAKDLLKANTADLDYEERNMPWGPNSQVLEVVVMDDEDTSVQSNTKVVKFNSDKELKLVNENFETIKTYQPGNDNKIVLDSNNCVILENTEYAENPGYKFYLVYEGTGIAKVEFYAEDSATEPNVRDYPSVATAADAQPVAYDAMLRVDTIDPEIKNVKLVQTENDVNDTGWELFTFNETLVEYNTRKKMKVTFDVVDETETTEQSGVNIQNEKIAGVDLIDVYGKYVETDKTHLYDDEATAYVTDGVNDAAIDPNIDYILLPVELDATGVNFDVETNEDIEALVNSYIDTVYNKDGSKCEWKKASWKDGAIVVPDEFQGAIVLRTIDRVGNIDYSKPVTFVAESREALIDFEPQNGYIWSQNNYGWSKRAYDYVEIRVKDDNEGKVDSWIENVFISVTDLEGNDISTKETVKFAHKIHANYAEEETDPSGYTYVSLADFANEPLYGYDVIDKDGLVETLARDKDGYIHLGYVRVEESAQIKVTVFDKAKHDDENDGETTTDEYTGNKTTGIWTSRIDRVAPTVNVEVVAVPASEHGLVDNNKVVLGLKANIADDMSGVAPAITDAEYNVYTPENNSYIYKITDDADKETARFDSGSFNAEQYELPGVQYALIPENGDLKDVKPWNFTIDPSTVYDENGYNGKMGATNVWHNYIDEKTPILPEEGFDGYVVVRAIDKAGNITVVGCAPTIDVEAAEGWHKDTQFVQVKASATTGSITKVEYSGNNNLLTHDENGNITKRDISVEAASGEGALIEVTEEGITDVIITASEGYTEKKTVKANVDYHNEAEVRNANYEGEMVVGNATATGFEDVKFQTVQVKIDKTAPEFDFALVDAADSEVSVGSLGFGIKAVDDEIADPIPNLPDVVGYRSHTPSGIAKVEYCISSEGMEEWKTVEEKVWKTGVIAEYAEYPAITGTVKVRVTDNAGNVTEKSKAINIDSATPFISMSKSYGGKCSHEPVEVLVAVSPGAEFSDISSVTYEVKDAKGNEVSDFYHNGTEKDLPLTGGVISIDKTGDYIVTVTAVTKGNESVSKSIEVKAHLDDLVIPTVNSYKEWFTGEETQPNYKVSIATDDKLEYSLDGAVWTPSDNKTISVKPGVHTLRLRAYKDCGCESDVNTYTIRYDNGTPNVTIDHDFGVRDVTVGDKVFNVLLTTNGSKVADVTPNKNNCASEIKSITYTITKDGEVMRENKNLPVSGGNIVLDEEGEWAIGDIIVTMESGKQFKFYEFDKDEHEVVTVIDKTAPKFDYAKATKGMSLFGLADPTNTKLNLEVSAIEEIINEVDDKKAIIVYEYALMEKGMVEPSWQSLGAGYSGDAITKENVIEVEFEGSILVKASDLAGNSTIKSIPVFTEGTKPEISMTYPLDWQTKDAVITIDIIDKGISSEIEDIKYTLKNNKTGDVKDGSLTGNNWAKLNSRGGQILVNAEGEYTLTVEAIDYAGNKGTQSVEVKIDKTAPTYSGSVSLGLFNVHTINNWNDIHDGWTYNHDVSVDGIVDDLSGVKEIKVQVTTETGAVNETTLNAGQTGTSFTTDGKYDLTITDNAGNVRNIGFVIDKDLENVINVIGVDEVGKVHVAVTDGDEMLTFFSKEDESGAKEEKMYNGVTDQLWDGKTGVKYIYGKNDDGKLTNKLHVIVAPSTAYGISLMGIGDAPNRYLDVDTEGENVTVKKIKEIFNPDVNENISVGSVLEINEDGIYTITTN